MEKLFLFFSRCMQSIDNNTLLLSLSASVCYTAANRCAMRASVELFLSLIFLLSLDFSEENRTRVLCGMLK